MVELRELQQRRADLEQRLARAETALRAARRADDARRKIVLGGAIIAAIKSGAIDASAVRQLLAKHASERDRRLFDGSSLATNSEKPLS
jgi:hypothetical protein